MNTNQGSAILAVNAGSSSLKFALYPQRGTSVDAATLTGTIEGLEPGGTPTMFKQPLPPGPGNSFEQALAALQKLLAQQSITISAVAHRIVHGGTRYATSVVIDDEAMLYLQSLSQLAPLHQPHNLQGVQAFKRAYPTVPQVGCFDTAFHATIPEVEYTYALPQGLRDTGIRRYGFHGLSYRYVVGQLVQRTPQAHGKVILAHLGNGASACAVAQGKSIATTMGFSTLDGLVMGTRSGAMDPGVLLHLLRQGWSRERIEKLLYQNAGLRGASGLSADMRTLRASTEPAAALAIALFTHRLVRECGALSACLGGLDAIAFTGGIGEHDSTLRQEACDRLQYLGVQIDTQRNVAAVGDSIQPIHANGSRVEVWVVPTDEGRVAAGDAAALCA